LKTPYTLIVITLIAALAYPPQWYPKPLRIQLTQWFGAGSYRSLPESMPMQPIEHEIFCPADPSGWRNAQSIDGVTIAESLACVADNPFLVAAAVKGTNNISHATLMASGLTGDAIEKANDLDGDGDPDEIHIRLEVAELNGATPLSLDPVTQYDIAPGIQPGLWVFAPKFVGMAVENFESQRARPALRLPSPAIRVEQGDRVFITLENSHYMPHTLHLHGADHAFIDANGEGNDGVPITSESPVMPGFARTYELTPRHAGTMFYHCHVQPHVHVMMGLQGLFIIEENRPNNWLQTLNIGAGLVRVPSRGVVETYDAEYDLHYQDLDQQLSERIRIDNDPRIITKSMHRDYDITDARPDYFTLNGRSFPYTFRESIVVGSDNDLIKLRVVNGGMKTIALHTHGHKFTVTHRDGTKVGANSETPRDVVTLATSQRLDLSVNLKNDGLHAYGPGIWPFHDHEYQGVTNDGIGPGGNISAIVYTDFLDPDGWPRTQGVAWDNYFTEQYYRKEIPVWNLYAPDLFGQPAMDGWILLRLLVLLVCLGTIIGILAGKVLKWREPNE